MALFALLEVILAAHLTCLIGQYNAVIIVQAGNHGWKIAPVCDGARVSISESVGARCHVVNGRVVNRFFSAASVAGRRQSWQTAFAGNLAVDYLQHIRRTGGVYQVAWRCSDTPGHFVYCPQRVWPESLQSWQERHRKMLSSWLMEFKRCALGVRPVDGFQRCICGPNTGS